MSDRPTTTLDISSQWEPSRDRSQISLVINSSLPERLLLRSGWEEPVAVAEDTTSLPSARTLHCESLQLHDYNGKETSAESERNLAKADTSIPGKQIKTSINDTPPPVITKILLGLNTVRHTVFTAYRRIFGVVFVANLATLIVVVAGEYEVASIINAASANIAVNGLARQEFFINGLYRAVGLVPRRAPLFIRRRLGKVFHYGGLHSGCGVASLLWFLLFIGKTTRIFATRANHGDISVATIALSYILLVTLIAIVTLAHPSLRIKYHDWFDHGHRTLAWTALILFWVLLLTAVGGLRRGTQHSYGFYLARFPPFWFTIIAVLCALSPWFWLRRVTVRPEKLSNHAIRLHFGHRPAGCVVGIKLARQVTGDWHSFAVFPSEDNLSFSALVSKAGDWTSKCIQDEPTKLWTRGYPLHGAAYVGSMFRKLVVVATGSGIGPIMGLLTSKDCPPCRVLWQTRNVRKTYGQNILHRILQVDRNAMIVDTDVVGRKDMLALVWNLYQESAVEAVFIVSNPKVTQRVVFGMEARGIPAYGPVFDS